MSINDVANFINIEIPPFASMTAASVDFEVRRLFQANVQEIEFLRKTSLCGAIILFIAERTPKLADSLPAMRQHLEQHTTLPQRFDMAVTLWCLTGDDKHVQFLVDHADGVTPITGRNADAYQKSAVWAVNSIGQQNPWWCKAVARIRSARPVMN